MRIEGNPPLQGFLTGSRVYGTPREDSDIDIVVFVSQNDLELLAEIALPKVDDPYEGMATAYLRFDKLNLLCVSEESDYEVWRQGTLDLIARKPVTRAEAVEHFEMLAAKKRAELQASVSEVCLNEEEGAW